VPYHGRETEGGFDAVPLRRHPHAEPFAIDRDEADQPDEETGRQADHGAVGISADHTRLRLLERGRRHHEGQRDVGPALP